MSMDIKKSIALIRLVPVISNAVEQLVEQYEKPNATGDQKKSSVLTVLRAGLETGEIFINIDLPVDSIINIADKLIDVIVDTKNLIGEFKHAAATAV